MHDLADGRGPAGGAGRSYASDDGHPGTAPVGSFPKGKTQAGLLDMVGNVFEWTADRLQALPGRDRRARRRRRA